MPSTIYSKYFKRFLDVLCASLALLSFSWLYLLLSVLVRRFLGSPVFFTQLRPGKDGKIFKLYKFRTMTDAKDADGNLLPDDVRLTGFGRWLRSTSLDEIPEAINILRGDMSVVGPRPQLVRDMVFMTEEQNKRHLVRPGLTGWAQVNGRNACGWDAKLKYDLEYINNGINFFTDVKIVFLTVFKAFIKQEGITEEGLATSADFGDYLLAEGRVDRSTYDAKQAEALVLLSSSQSA